MYKNLSCKNSVYFKFQLLLKNKNVTQIHLPKKRRIKKSKKFLFPFSHHLSPLTRRDNTPPSPESTLTILQFINSDQMPGLYGVASIANLRSSSSLASTLGPLANWITLEEKEGGGTYVCTYACICACVLSSQPARYISQGGQGYRRIREGCTTTRKKVGTR